MRKIGLLILMMCLGASVWAKDAAAIDRMVAIVNDGIITQSELDKRLILLKAQMEPRAKAAGQMLPPDSVIKEQLLNQLIDRELMLQMAKKTNISVTKKEMQKALQMASKAQNMTLSQFYKQLEKKGLDKKEIDRQMKAEVLIQKLQGRAVASMVHLSPAAVEKAYREQAKAGMEYHVGDLLIADEAQSQKLYQEMLKQKNFQAKEPTDMGWRSASDLPEIFLKTVAALKKDEISKPIKAPNGYHILKLYGKRGGKLSKEEIRNRLFDQQFGQKLEEFIKNLRQQAYIKRIED